MERSRQVHVERVMGTVVSVHVRGARDAALALVAVTGLLHAVDARFSTYRDDSEVCRYRRGELHAAQEAELGEVLQRCVELQCGTDGAFDAWAGGAFDPSAWVKGWAVDRAGALLLELGFDDWMIDAGGDVLVHAPERSAPWRIGVQHPTDPRALCGVISARRLAVATSGAWFRGDHVRDPRTGGPARGALASTVCGPSLGTADALSTAAFVLAGDGPAMVRRHPGYECAVVLDDGRVRSTGAYPRSVHGVPVAVEPRRAPKGAAA